MVFERGETLKKLHYNSLCFYINNHTKAKCKKITSTYKHFILFSCLDLNKIFPRINPTDLSQLYYLQ